MDLSLRNIPSRFVEDKKKKKISNMQHLLRCFLSGGDATEERLLTAGQEIGSHLLSRLGSPEVGPGEERVAEATVG